MKIGSHRVKFALCAVLTISAGVAAQAESTIGKLYEVTAEGPIFAERSVSSAIVETVYPGERRIVLSNSSEFARVIVADGSHGFVNFRDLKFIKSITLSFAIKTLREYERQIDDALSDEDKSALKFEAAPWVWLVAGELDLKKPSTAPKLQSVSPPIDQVERAFSELTITNDTSRSISVYMTGVTTTSVTIGAGGTKSIFLRPGTYTSYVTSSDSSVRPYRGTDDIKPNHNYSVKYYIVTTYRRG